MSDRALLTADRARILRTAPASAGQLVKAVGAKPYWNDIVDADKPRLGGNERLAAPVLTIREKDVLRSWPVETIPPVRTDADRLDDEVNNSPLMRALVRQLAADKGVTPAQVVTALKQRLAHRDTA